MQCESQSRVPVRTRDSAFAFPAGKSTLLDVLAGRTTGKGVSGTVSVNGLPITPETSNMYISYVGQEDVFMPTLSAWESLSFITQLCMGPLPRCERESRMESVLTTMGLARVKNSKVFLRSNAPSPSKFGFGIGGCSTHKDGTITVFAQQ